MTDQAFHTKKVEILLLRAVQICCSHGSQSNLHRNCTLGRAAELSDCGEAPRGGREGEAREGGASNGEGPERVGHDGLLLIAFHVFSVGAIVYKKDVY